MCVHFAHPHTHNSNINNTLKCRLYWLLSNIEQLVYNTLPVSYPQGILGVKGFMPASIKHKGVTFNCEGDRRWDKTNYLYSLTAVFYLTSALDPFPFWPVCGGHEKIYSLGCSRDTPTAWIMTVIYRYDGFVHLLLFFHCKRQNKRWLIVYKHVRSHCLSYLPGLKSPGLV